MINIPSEIEMKKLSETQKNDFELECITKIWDYYYKEVVNQERVEVPISFLLIKLMEVLKQSNNKELMTKALLITISFFQNVPADLYNRRGIDINLLPQKYRKKALLLLRQEFLLN